MMSDFAFTVEIAGISIRFEAPRIMEIPPELKHFLTEKTQAQEWIILGSKRRRPGCCFFF
jgi:hypothetical protein